MDTKKMMLTIKELSIITGYSQYEIRRRVHNGTLPHTRVGAKQTKILIDENIFKQLLAEESLNNMQSLKRIVLIENNTADDDSIGYGKIRLIN